MITEEKIENVTFELCDNLINKADKYYISFRIVNHCGFYFQAINSLLFSLESFFKLLYLLEKDTYTENELKNIGHDLKKLIKNVGLNKNKFQNIWNAVLEYDYTKIRYNDNLLLNKINYKDRDGDWPYLKAISLEILELHKLITEKMRKKFNTPDYQAFLVYNRWNIQPTKIKEFIEESLSRGDEVFMSVDVT